MGLDNVASGYLLSCVDVHSDINDDTGFFTLVTSFRQLQVRRSIPIYRHQDTNSTKAFNAIYSNEHLSFFVRTLRPVDIPGSTWKHFSQTVV